MKVIFCMLLIISNLFYFQVLPQFAHILARKLWKLQQQREANSSGRYFVKFLLFRKRLFFKKKLLRHDFKKLSRLRILFMLVCALAPVAVELNVLLLYLWVAIEYRCKNYIEAMFRWKVLICRCLYDVRGSQDWERDLTSGPTPSLNYLSWDVSQSIKIFEHLRKILLMYLSCRI